MQEKFFDIHPEVNKYSQLAYSEPSFLFYGDSVIKSCKGTQQGDPESSALLSNSIQDLNDNFELKPNLWYLDEGNLGDDSRTALEDYKQIVEALGLRIKPRKCEFFSLMTSLKNDNRHFQHLSKQFAPAPVSKRQREMNLSLLVR